MDIPDPPEIRACATCSDSHGPEREIDMTTESLFNVATRVAPAPSSREGANRETWVKHCAAQALAAYATFRAELRTLTPNPPAGSRPDLGYLILAATSATAATAALTDQTDYAPTLIWDLTPEAGALNGEWEEWLADVLVRYGVNPGHIDPDLDPADFTEAVRTLGPSSEPFVCPSCQETAYLHVPGCVPKAATARSGRPDSVAQASQWIDASGIPVYPAEAVRAWLDRLGVPVPAGIQALMVEIRRAVIAAGDAGYAEGLRAQKDAQS